MNQKSVTIYTTPQCHFCHMSKEFFKEHGVEYTEHNVAANHEKLHEMVEKSGQMGVPVIQIGEDIVIGFDRPVLKELLGITD